MQAAAVCDAHAQDCRREAKSLPPYAMGCATDGLTVGDLVKHIQHQHILSLQAEGIRCVSPTEPCMIEGLTAQLCSTCTTACTTTTNAAY